MPQNLLWKVMFKGRCTYFLCYVTLLLGSLVNVAHASEQVLGILTLRDFQAYIYETPLIEFFHSEGRNFRVIRTSNRKGYEATWAIISRKLYVSGISGIDAASGEEQSMSSVFGDKLDGNGYFLQSYTGTITMLRGPRIGYTDKYQPIFKYVDQYDVTNGVVKTRRIIADWSEGKKE